MDIQEFIKRERPTGRRPSRIEPFLAQVQRLKAAGYSDQQVRAFLAENGVRVTQPTVSRFVVKHDLRNQLPVADAFAQPAALNLHSETTGPEQRSIETPTSKPKPGIGDLLNAATPSKKSIKSIISNIDNANES